MIEINTKKLATLFANNLTVDEYLLLRAVNYPEEYQWIIDMSFKFTVDSLIQKGLINNDKQITEKGYDMIVELAKDFYGFNEEDFEKLFELYPRNDKWAHFKSTRSLRGNKRLARIAYSAAIGKGHSPEIIRRGLVNCIESYKARSIATNSNAFSYLPKLTNWLEAEEFLAFEDEELPIINHKIIS